MDGIILINKPKNCTSHDVVAKIKNIVHTKVGHTGTLDPNATGLLPILVGKGTKLSYYLMDHDKEYEVALQLGIKTETADVEGKILEMHEVDSSILQKERIERVLQSFLGKQMQIPPIYSAIKVKGKKLYEYARENKTVEIKPKEIEIYKITLKHIDEQEKVVFFTVSCSKGTYIRSLCENIAEKLGTVGYMKELNRTKVGIFDLKDSITMEELEKEEEKKEFLQQHIISIEKLFLKLYGENNKIILGENNWNLFFNGVKLTFDLPDGLYRIYNQKQAFMGIGSIKDKLLKREIVTV